MTASAAPSVTLRFRADGGTQRDAVAQTLPVLRYAPPAVTLSAGSVTTDTVIISVPPTAAAAAGSTILRLTPSLGASLLDGLAYQLGYPYGCTEQTTSRFLPNIAAYRLAAASGDTDPALRQQLNQNMSLGVQRLTALQHPDGGWGWWENDGYNAFLTAYALLGLTSAADAGATVDQTVVERGFERLKSVLDSADTSPDTQALGLYLLARSNRADLGRTIALYERRAALSVDGQSWLLLAFDGLGGQPDRSRTLVQEIAGAAVVAPDSVRWTRGADWYSMGSPLRTTALAVWALSRADPANPLIPGAVRYLMQQRVGSHWATTQETAIVVLALAAYLGAGQELQPRYDYEVLLEGQPLARGTVGAAEVGGSREIALPASDATRQLTIVRRGVGRLYYTLADQRYPDPLSAAAVSHGMEVSRRYVAVDPVTLRPTGATVSAARLGEVVQVELILNLNQTGSYLALEDSLPAGLEPVDASLRTSSAAARPPGRNGWEGWWYFDRSEIHDQRVALFASWLYGSTYSYTYLARATTPGTFSAAPAQASMMYAPEVMGSSRADLFRVTP